jgi:threonine aldolase
LAQKHNLKVHMDGARIFNAAVALGVDLREMTRSVDTVCFCLSKGLACPVGSVLCGPKDFINEARRYRKMVGGGMRQAGVLAAAGLYALDHMVARLADDHANARRLAEGLAQLPGAHLDLASVQSNIVIFDLTSTRLSPPAFLAAMAERGIKFNSVIGPRFRLVTHYGIEAADVDLALSAFRAVLC